jgi:hypothetical protein
MHPRAGEAAVRDEATMPCMNEERGPGCNTRRHEIAQAAHRLQTCILSYPVRNLRKPQTLASSVVHRVASSSSLPQTPSRHNHHLTTPPSNTKVPFKSTHEHQKVTTEKEEKSLTINTLHSSLAHRLRELLGALQEVARHVLDLAALLGREEVHHPLRRRAARHGVNFGPAVRAVEEGAAGVELLWVAE